MSVLDKLKRIPKAAEVFGETLASDSKRALATRGSAAQRFADAPLGQYYLPHPVQGALSFLGAPSPRKVARDTKGVIQNPSAGNLLAETNNAIGIAGLPGLVTGGVGLSRAGARGAAAAAATRGLPLTERLGLAARAAKGGYLFHGTTELAADAIRTGGFKPSTLAHISGKGPEVVYGTAEVGTAMKYAKNAARLTGKERVGRVFGPARRPAIVAFKSAAEPVAAGAGGFAYPARAVRAAEAGEMNPAKILQFPNRAADVARRVKNRVTTHLAEQADLARPRDLSGKIAAIREELDQMGPAVRDLSSTMPRKAKSLARTLNDERGALGKGRTPAEAARLAKIREGVKMSERGEKLALSVMDQKDVARQATHGYLATEPLPKGSAGLRDVRFRQNLAKRELAQRQILRATGVDTSITRSPAERGSMLFRTERNGEVLQTGHLKGDYGLKNSPLALGAEYTSAGERSNFTSRLLREMKFVRQSRLNQARLPKN